MYSLDINFLNDRPEYKPEAVSRVKGPPTGQESQRPFILGLVVAIALPLMALGAWWFLNSRNTALEEELASINQALGDLQTKKDQLSQIQKEAADTQKQARDLASVFNLIKPSSVLLKDIQDRTPPNVQVLAVRQVPLPPGSPSPSPGAPVDVGTLEIVGVAQTFSAVNDFALVLQQSPFLQADATRVAASELLQPENFTNLQLENVPQVSVPDRLRPELPRQVRFTIASAPTQKASSELLPQLEKAQGVGLTTRIETLQKEGLLGR